MREDDRTTAHVHALAQDWWTRLLHSCKKLSRPAGHFCVVEQNAVQRVGPISGPSGRLQVAI